MLTAAAVAQREGRSIADIERVIELAKRSLAPVRQRIVVRDGSDELYLSVTRNGVGPLKTKHGLVHQFDFHIADLWSKYSVLFVGAVDEDFQPILAPNTSLRLRIDSGCETGQMFGDLTCECRQQLDEALHRLADRGGLIINIPSQDGRGFGLPHKLATLRLQLELNVHTVDAGDLLIPDGSKDVRTYAGVVAILKFLGVPTDRTITLMSNNEKKIGILVENGYTVEQEELAIAPTEHTREHLRAKQELLGHKGLIKDED